MENSRHELLRVEIEAKKKELEFTQARFEFRLIIAWLTLGNLIFPGLMVLGNLLIDFRHPGGGREMLNLFGTAFSLVSIGGSCFMWHQARLNLMEIRSSIEQLHVARRHLLAPGEALSAGAFMQYKEEIPAIMEDYRRGAQRYRRWHNWFQMTVILGSITASLATTAAANDEHFRWSAVAISGAVSASAGIIGYYKFRERSMNLQQSADLIDQELQAFNLGIRRYKGMSAESAQAELAEEVERIREEQRKREQQLEQPPEGNARATDRES